MDRNSLIIESRSGRYIAAVLLAIAAQVARVPLPSPTIVPFITHAPFIVISAILGGLGPGLVATLFCTLESIYFAVEPSGSFAISDPTNWYGIGALVVTGVVASALAESARRTSQHLSESQGQLKAMLDSIHDGFNSFDREWRYTYVNRAAARMVGMTPEELLGKNLWELWPLLADSPFGIAYRRAVAENVPVQVEAFYGEPLNAWFEVRCYPSPHGLSLFFTNTTERRRTLEQLRLMESAILQTSDGVLIVKVSGDETCCQAPVFANHSFERITGYTLEELQQGALGFLFSQGPNPHAREGRPSGFRETCPEELEQRVVRKDGSEFWAEWGFRPLADAGGNYTHCVWTCRDITERKRAAENLRLLSSIVECSDDAIISEALDGTVRSWNKGAERVYGYSAEEMVGQSINCLTIAGHEDEIPEILDYVKLGEKIENLETERVRKDGRHIFVAVTISPLRDDAGVIVGASAIAHDISDRKHNAKLLEQSELRYRSLVRVVGEIVWTTSPEGEVTEDIPAWREFTGKTFEEIEGKRWVESLHPDDRESTVDIWSRAVRNRSFYVTEYRMRRRDGEYRWMSVHGVPVFGDGGQILEWVGLCSDITGRVMAEEAVRELNQSLEKRVVERTAELQAANKELEAFAYSVSHDLRAPLRAVDGFSRILLEEYAPQLPAEAQRYLQIARGNAVQMGKLIDALLAFSRLGRQALSWQRVQPAELVRHVLVDLASEQEGRQVDVSVGELPPCEGDALLLKQMFFNLLSNALKYTRKRDFTRIEVGAFQFVDLDKQTEECQRRAPRLSRDVVVYYVRDNGAGFDMRYADKLFGVFQRLHKADEYEGTGVGLATVFRIVNRHGGHVWAEGALDGGATFYFTLAASSSACAPSSGDPESSEDKNEHTAPPIEV